MRYVFLILFLLTLPAHAQEMGTAQDKPDITYPTLEPEPQVLKKTGTARVTSIIDALRLQLDDKRVLQLSSLDIPDMNQAEAGEIAFAAKASLEELFQDKKINIYQSINTKKGRTNRMGHTLAHITLAEDENNIWAQGALLQAGLARVRTTQDNRALASEMYDIETKARKAALLSLQGEDTQSNLSQTSPDEAGEGEAPNLWTMDEYALLTPETAANARRNFQIVEGTIRKTAINKNRFYLNFGDRWQTDFTFSIAPEHRRLFSKEGYNPLEWSGRKVRVRGWLDEYNGPYIDIDHPERIEFIDENEDKPEPNTPKSALPDIP